MLSADLLPADPRPADAPGSAAFFGGRWALILATALVILFSGTVAVRGLLSASPAKMESIVQQPVTAEVSAAAGSQRAEVTAPDPGDNPP